VGAVLGQRDDLGFDHPIAYFTKKLLPNEENIPCGEGVFGGEAGDTGISNLLTWVTFHCGNRS